MAGRFASLLTVSIVTLAASVKIEATKINIDGQVTRPKGKPTASTGGKPTGGGGPSGGSVNVDFGGVKTGFERDNSFGDINRPEQVKSRVCDGDTCTDCIERSECWHGPADNKDAQSGASVLMVPASSQHDRYEGEVWAKCFEDDHPSTLQFQVKQISNGKLKLYLDGVLLETMTKKGNYRLTIGKDMRLHVSYTRNNNAQAGSATIKMKAKDVQKRADDCMGLKYCLKTLGDGSKSSFDLRNKNFMQLACLEAANANQRSQVTAMCPAWVTCLQKHNHAVNDLLVMLRSTMREGTFLEEVAAGQNTTRRNADPDACVDPSSEDPESWDCDCFDAMKATCPNQQATSPCFHDLLCNDDRVCNSWKCTHGCSSCSLLDTEQAVTERLMRRKPSEDKENAAEVSLEESLSDKRSC